MRPPRCLEHLGRWSCAALALALACTWACGGAPPGPARRAPAPPRAARPAPRERPACPAGARFGELASFAIDRADLRRRGASEALLGTLDRSAYKYFRLLGPAFAARTCWAFRDLRWRLPVVAVHGDAHLTQLVVTRETFGLEDFDQAGYGPAVVDLVRYATSLHLACRDVSFSCDPEQAVGAYLGAYRDALDRPPERPAPDIIARLRRTTPQDTEAWLRWTDSLALPMQPDEEALHRREWSQFVSLMSDVQPERPAEFYQVVRLGSLRMGIGSALERKMLIRLRGPSDDPSDDVVLEARQIPAPSGRDCVWRPLHGGSLHPLLFMSLLGPRMPRVYGFVPLDPSPDAPEFWVQAWEPGYRELTLADLEQQADLDELAADAARQLAGHFWMRFPEPLRGLQRHAQLDAFDRVETRARDLARTLAAEVVREWEGYRAPPAPRAALGSPVF